MQYIEKMQEAISPSINSRVGSPVYFMLCQPTNDTYEVIEQDIRAVEKNSSLKTTSQADIILNNFGVSLSEGRKARGRLTLLFQNSVSPYSIPKGSYFIYGDNTRVVVVKDAYGSGTSLEVEVESEFNTDQVYLMGDSFTSTLYGNLVEACLVSTTIAGGKADESLEDYKEKIFEKGTYTSSYIKKQILERFPSVIDVICAPSRTPSSTCIAVEVLVKCTTKIVTATTTEIGGPILRILSTTGTVTAIENEYLANQKTYFSKLCTTTYIAPVELQDIQTYIDTTMEVPIGVKLIATHPAPVFVSGDIAQDYVDKHPLKQWEMSAALKTKATYTLPFILYFNGEAVQNTYGDKYTAFYYERIT